MARRTEFADVADEVVARLRAIAMALPDAGEEQAWTGVRWVVRKRNFAHVFAVDGPTGPATMVAVRVPDEDLRPLLASGHPFFDLGWGRNAVGMVLDATTDWDEVAEVVTDSYCVLAPKKLVALVGRPDPPDPP